MFKAIKINNFRCFDDFEFGNLTKINLISGKNSVGKTALLEAIFLLIGAENISWVLKVSGFRGLTDFAGDIDNMVDLIWTSLFITSNPIEKILYLEKLRTNEVDTVSNFVLDQQRPREFQ